MEEIKIGDVVHLKSDPEHKFTVCEVSDGTIKCYSSTLLRNPFHLRTEVLINGSSFCVRNRCPCSFINWQTEEVYHGDYFFAFFMLTD